MKKMALTRVSTEDLERLRQVRELSIETAAAELANEIEARWELMTVEQRATKLSFKIRPAPGQNAGWVDRVRQKLLTLIPDGFEVETIRSCDRDSGYEGYFGQIGYDDLCGDVWTREPDVEV